MTLFLRRFYIKKQKEVRALASPYFFIYAIKLVEVELVEHVAKSLSLFNGNGNALTHLLMIGRPGADVVNGLSLVPADKIELLVPAVVAFANYTYFVNYFVLDFRHFRILLM